MVTRIAKVTRRNQGLYPWDKWTDGKPRRAVKGKDFNCSPSGFAATLYTHAQRNDRRVTVSIDGDSVEFQFSAPVPSP